MRELKALEPSFAKFVDPCNASCAGGLAPQCTILQDLALTEPTADPSVCCP